MTCELNIGRVYWPIGVSEYADGQIDILRIFQSFATAFLPYQDD